MDFITNLNMPEPETSLAQKIIRHTHIANNKTYFKYILDKPIYDLIEYCIITKPMRVEFFTTNKDYKKIWEDLRIQEKWGLSNLIEQGYEDIYNCYNVEVSAPSLIHFAEVMRKQFKKMHYDTFKTQAEGKGYLDADEVHNDWCKFKLGYIL